MQCVSEGYALLEHWTVRNGIIGTGLSYYDLPDEHWDQHWVGDQGRILHLFGGDCRATGSF